MKKVGDKPASPADTGDDSADAVESEGETLLPPLTGDTPVVFRFAGNGAFEGSDTARQLVDLDARQWHSNFAGRRVAVDARTGGLADGLLDAKSNGVPVTIEDEAWDPSGGGDDRPSFRVRLLGEREPANADPEWREARADPFRMSPEGEAATWLVVEKFAGSVAGEDARSLATNPQRLAEHRKWVACEADNIARAIGLGNADRAMLVAAALRHDDGKAAPRWQRAFNAPTGDEPFAKTAGPVNWRLLNGYRHEFQSVLDAQRRGPKGMEGFDGARFDLALHLIAAHHGRARPSMDIEGCDSLPPTAAAQEAHRIALRFARLQRQWGPWGLAWWEALLRAADQRASRRNDRPANPDATDAGAAHGDASQTELFAAAGSARR